MCAYAAYVCVLLYSYVCVCVCYYACICVSPRILYFCYSVICFYISLRRKEQEQKSTKTASILCQAMARFFLLHFGALALLVLCWVHNVVPGYSYWLNAFYLSCCYCCFYALTALVLCAVIMFCIF